MRIKRLRLHHALLSCAVSISCSIVLAPPAMAQSFFQKLFGFGGNEGPKTTARPAHRAIPSVRFNQRTGPRTLPQSHAEDDDAEIGPPDSGGPYRTMCVRACDGYYFPLRHNAKRRNFAADAKSCRAACGSEARLFYYPVHGGSVDMMTDLAGRAYKQQPHAFGYRKALVSGCTCKAVPWSYEEAARHRGYAEEEKELLAEAHDQAVRRYTAAVGEEAAKKTLAVIDLDALPPSATAANETVDLDAVPSSTPDTDGQAASDPPVDTAVAQTPPVEAGETIAVVNAETPRPRAKRKRMVRNRGRAYFVTTSARTMPASKFYRSMRR